MLPFALGVGLAFAEKIQKLLEAERGFARSLDVPLMTRHNPPPRGLTWRFL